MITDPSNFRQWLLTSARAEAERHFQQDTLICLIPRETIWYSITLFESGQSKDIVLANRILENMQATDGTHSPCALFVVFDRYTDLLSPAAKDNILENLRKNLPISATIRYSDGNVNHPVAAMIHLICGGELLDMPAFTHIGKLYLQNFHKIISSRYHKQHIQAEMSEYNSPTYTALTLWFLAIGAEFALDREARELALFLEQSLWMNVALHWHNPSQQFAGPFSRAYGEDSAGGYSALHCTFAYATNQPVYIEPELPVRFSHPSALIENAMIAVLAFHFPDKARKIAFDKTFPVYYRMTTYCEQYHENSSRSEKNTDIPCFDDEVYPGGWGDLTTYLTNDFCLGSASRPYVNGGQNDIFSLRYRRSNNTMTPQAFRGMYTRLVFNNSVVGKENICHTVGSTIDSSYLYEEGRGFVYQHKNSTIVNYVPKRSGNRNISEIRLDLIFSYHSPFDKLMVDSRPVSDLPCELLTGQNILIRDGRVCLVILPCSISDDENKGGRIWTFQDHLMFSFFLYKGESRDFSREDLSRLFFSFACILQSVDNVSNLDDFLNVVNGIDFRDELLESRYRQSILRRDSDEMIFIIDPIAERVVQRTWNGADESLFHTEVESDDDLVRDFVKKGPYVR